MCVNVYVCENKRKSRGGGAKSMLSTLMVLQLQLNSYLQPGPWFV